jgi:hypothetical protein
VAETEEIADSSRVLVEGEKEKHTSDVNQIKENFKLKLLSKR